MERRSFAWILVVGFLTIGMPVVYFGEKHGLKIASIPNKDLNF